MSATEKKQTPNNQGLAEMWAERVRQWEQSGQAAREFVKGRGYAVSTLYRWAERLAASSEPIAPVARLEPSKPTRFVQLVTKEGAVAPAPEVVVEVGAARVRVGTGFNAVLLAEVVRALRGTP